MIVMAALIGVALVLLAAIVGIVGAWTAQGCYPWRRCGRCGMDEWRIFRRSGRNDTPSNPTLANDEVRREVADEIALACLGQRIGYDGTPDDFTKGWNGCAVNLAEIAREIGSRNPS